MHFYLYLYMRATLKCVCVFAFICLSIHLYHMLDGVCARACTCTDPLPRVCIDCSMCAHATAKLRDNEIQDVECKRRIRDRLIQKAQSYTLIGALAIACVCTCWMVSWRMFICLCRTDALSSARQQAVTARAMSFLQTLIIRSLVFFRSFRRRLLRGNPHCLLRGCSQSLNASI